MSDLNKAQRHLRRRDDYYNNALKLIFTPFLFPFLSSYLA
jgi:hypothetical protein